jgi:hypothetical protein
MRRGGVLARVLYRHASAVALLPTSAPEGIAMALPRSLPTLVPHAGTGPCARLLSNGELTSLDPRAEPGGLVTRDGASHEVEVELGQ